MFAIGVAKPDSRVAGDVRGKVYFWDHEEEPNGDADWSNVDLIVDSFDLFLSGLVHAEGDKQASVAEAVAIGRLRGGGRRTPARCDSGRGPTRRVRSE